jgi:hypothetical protein
MAHLLRVPICALQCSPYPRTAALLARTSGLLATVTHTIHAVVID